MRKIAKKLLILYLRMSRRSKISLSAHVNFRTKLEGFNALHEHAVLSGAEIGFASFVGRNSCLPNSKIGRYCSIGHNVEVITQTHPSSNFVSTHPAFYSRLKQSGFTYSSSQKFKENLAVDTDGKLSVCIGNDVWLGAHSLIMGGITISDGAIVAAGSVVTRNVPPYAIVGGVPARLIRMRFSDVERKYLEDLRWWDRDRTWIESNYECFEDIKLMMQKNFFNNPSGGAHG